MKKSIESVFLVFAFLAVLLSGCAPASTPVPPTPTPVPPTDIPPTATPIPPTATEPGGLPSYVPIYPNAKIVQQLSENVTEFVTSDTFEQVAAFYQKSLAPLGDEGWEDGIMGGRPGFMALCNASKCEGMAVLKKSDQKGNQEIQITVSENADKSVRITLGYFDHFVYNATP